MNFPIPEVVRGWQVKFIKNCKKIFKHKRRNMGFPGIFRNPLLRITIFRSHTPLESHFSPPPPPGILHHFFSHPLEFHGNPLSSIMTPWNFPILNITSWNFPDFHFKTLLEFPLSSTGGIRKISEKAQ